MSAPSAAPYEQLLELITRELELVGEGSFEALRGCEAVRQELIDRLPTTPPAAARGALERCWLMTRRLELELRRAREAVLVELALVRRAQRAARGYAPRRQPPSRFSADA